MKLNQEQSDMLNGKYGEVVKRMLRLLVRLGEVYGADRMLEIGSAQISGVSYKSIGEPGLLFLEDIAVEGAKVRVLTTLNPAGMDLQDWRELGFPEEFASKQQRIIKAFIKMGVVGSATCTPYLAGNLPGFGEHIAWAESSAVCFANSVIGARTNREGGPSALAAAICGCTPNYGLHIKKNREPAVRVNVEVDLLNKADFSVLGCYVGKRVRGSIPYFIGIEKANTDDLKTLGAAMAATGSVALFHVEGFTPEANDKEDKDLETIRVGKRELQEVYTAYRTTKKPDHIVVGCPHASMREMVEIAEKLEGKRLRIPLWICTSRGNKEFAISMGLAEQLNHAGAKIVADTCMVVSPIEKMGFETTAVNSGKAANYLPGFCQQNVVFQNIDQLIEEAVR